MFVYVFMNHFSTALQEKYGLEVIINNQQFLLKKDDGRFYKFPLNKEKNGYLKTKSSTKDDVIQNIVSNRITKINSSLTLSMEKNVLAFEKLNYMLI